MPAKVIHLGRYQRDWRARDPQPLEPMAWPEPPQTSVVRNAAMLLAALAGGALLWALSWRS